MKQFHKTAIKSLPIIFYFIISLICYPIFAQEKSAIKSYTPEAISDAFAVDAVTTEDMIERARFYPYMPEEIVVAVELNVSKASAKNQIREYNWSQFFGNKKVKPIAYLMIKEQTANKSVSLVHLSLAKDMDVFEAMQILDGNPDIHWSSPNFYFEGDPREIIPNDPSYGSQYHHPLMQNDLAWDFTYGNADIMLGITDDGVEITHSDLNTNIWVNPGEIAGNGIDDDNNGYIDDVNGWDFSSGNNDPNPNSLSNDHGTHVSGICAGRTDNSIGIAGVSGHSTILPIQFYGVGAWTATVCNSSFTYAADNGANVVNTSYNIDGWVGDPVFTAGMQYMHDAGVLHFNSGGNGSALNPARQAFEQGLLTVSTDASDMKSGFSNYGTGMDISAPGSDIYSSVTSNGYGYKSGTSMAAPNAAGAAALIWSANPSWNSYQVAAQLLATADDIDGVNPSYAGLLGAGRVNTYSAMSTTLGPPILKSTEGMPDEGSTVPPDDIDEFTVSFSQIMDPATVNNIDNFELIGAGPDNTFGSGDDISYTLSTSTTYMLGTNYLTFEVSGPPFTQGLHRIRLISGGLSNPFGTALDGDENGTGGDDFIRNFTIGIPVPVADFAASNTNPVPDADVIFTDLTWGGPSAWTWTITPATFSFVNGTDANSQNPEVQFADFGYYSVTLEVSNSAGSDIEIKLDYINVITCVYCPAEGNNGSEEWISNVTFNTIDNSSVAGTGYTNYTSISTDVDAGSTYDIFISCGSTGNWDENYWVYFDWNQDCDFDDPGESFDLGETNGPGTLTTSVLVPADAVPGTVRMRAFLKYNSDPTSACEDGFSFGEVEDYTVNVGGGTVELCVPEYSTGCSLGDGFTDFAIEEIENYDSGCEDLNGIGWSQYFELGPATLTAGQSHDLVVSSGYTGNFVSIWIDFNDDGILLEDERVLENYWIELANQLYTVQLEIPADANLGVHYMRARTNFANFCDGPCELYSYGEAEDYMVDIQEGGTTATCEDFDALTPGDYVALELGGNWTTWTGAPGTAEDGLVSDMYSLSPSNSILVEGTTDLVHLITGDNITSGKWSYSLNIYVPDGTTGYFNLQKDVVPGTEWGFQVMFEDDMTMIVDGGAAAAAIIPYNYDQWYFCEMIVDLDNDWCEFYVDDNLELGYQWTLGTFGTVGALTLAGSNIFANPGAGGTPPGAHFDDICFEELENVVWAKPENVMAVVENEYDVHVTWDAPSVGDPTGYDVYRDDEFLANVTATEYVDQALEYGTYEYCVVAVYDGGESQPACADPVTIVEPLFPPGPTNLIGPDEITNGTPIDLTWTAPGEGEWIHWDAGVNNGNGVGLTNGGTFSVAARWTVAELAPYNGLSLLTVSFFPNADPDATYVLKVWTGANGATEIYSQDIPSFTVSEWNEVDLTTPVVISSTADFWIGYEVTHTAGMFPAGSDDGPAIQYSGDMISTAGTWESAYVLTGGAIDANWNVQGWVALADGKGATQATKLVKPYATSTDFIANGSTGVSNKFVPTADNSKDLESYNVYRSIGGGAFSVIGNTLETEYTDEDVTVTEIYEYYVTAVWDPEGESYPSNTWMVDVITGIEDVLFNSTLVYPNPASEVVNIKSDFDITSVKVFNHSGQIVAEEMVHNKMYQFNTSQYNAGMYFFQVETTEGTISKRIIIQ